MAESLMEKPFQNCPRIHKRMFSFGKMFEKVRIKKKFLYHIKDAHFAFTEMELRASNYLQFLLFSEFDVFKTHLHSNCFKTSSVLKTHTCTHTQAEFQMQTEIRSDCRGLQVFAVREVCCRGQRSDSVF